MSDNNFYPHHSSPEQLSTSKLILQEFENVCPANPKRRRLACSQHGAYAGEKAIISSQPPIVKATLNKISHVAGRKITAGYQPDSIANLWANEMKEMEKADPGNFSAYHKGKLLRKQGIRKCSYIILTTTNKIKK